MPSTRKRVIANNRRQKVADMYLSGKSQTEIAESLNTTQATISRDIKAIQKEWLKNATMSIDEVKSRELEQIDKLKKIYTEAWEKSCLKGNGDPRFLAGIQWCAEQRLKIFGGYAPIKSENKEVNIPDFSKLSFEELYELKYGHKPMNRNGTGD